MDKKKKNILITGPLGHIGSAVIHNPVFFKNIGRVVLMDNFATLRYPSLFNLPGEVNFKFIEDDILGCDYDRILENIDTVIHLAAITDAANSFDIEEKVMSVNLAGTRRIAEACAKNNVSLVLISTTSVYGTQNDVVDENCSADELKPQSPYAKSKLFAEESLFQTYSHNNSFRFVICRFGTIYGTSVGMRFHTAINKFIWQAVMEQPITVWSTALHQRRPYLSLHDAVNALSWIIEKDIFPNEVFNVLSLNITVNDIIEEIKKTIPDVKVNFVDSKIMNQLSYTVSNKKFTDSGFKFRGTIGEVSEIIDLLKNANCRASN
jgi:nucleoside-diphosphate-sugar epimerase